jgi:hypothetical protein
MDSTSHFALDAVVAATGSTKETAGQLDLKNYIPVFSFFGALIGGILAAFAQVQVARFNADRSDRSRLAVRREEIVSEGVLGLVRLDPFNKKDGEVYQLALRSANSIKLFLDGDRGADKRLEKALDDLVYHYNLLAYPNQDDELDNKIRNLENPDPNASLIEMEREMDRLDELRELLEHARTEVLMAARKLIADDRKRLQSQSTPR